MARRERALLADADEVERILTEEASSIAAPELVNRVRDDIDNAAKLLEGSDTSELTRLVQDDVANGIRDLIEALENDRAGRAERRRQGARRSGLSSSGSSGGQEGGQQGGQEGGQQGDDESLITPVTELRMLARAQRRLRERTERLARIGLGGDRADAGSSPGDADPAIDPPEPLDPEREKLARQQAERIALAQSSLGDATRGLRERYPIIDRVLLGLRPVGDEDDSASDSENGAEDEGDSADSEIEAEDAPDEGSAAEEPTPGEEAQPQEEARDGDDGSDVAEEGSDDVDATPEDSQERTDG